MSNVWILRPAQNDGEFGFESECSFIATRVASSQPLRLRHVVLSSDAGADSPHRVRVLLTQLAGLVGAHDLLPVTRFFTSVCAELGPAAYLQLPSLCWFFGAGAFLHVLSAGGTPLSLLLFAGVAPALCLALLWVGYLALSCADQIFLNFQWALAPLWRLSESPCLTRLLLGWLLFRLMFLAGVVKLASGDPRWQDLSALTFHDETQPLPTPLAWHVHQFPACPPRLVLRHVRD